MRASTIMAHALEDIQNLLRSAPSEVRSDHTRMRATICEAVVGRQRFGCQPPAASAGPTAMEVDAIGKCKGNKGRGENCSVCEKPGHAAATCWWNDSRRKGKGAATKTGGPSAKLVDSKFTGKCNYCHKTGNKMADCRKKAADAMSKGGGRHAISAEQGSGSTQTGSVAAIEQAIESDEKEFFCMVDAQRAGGGGDLRRHIPHARHGERLPLRSDRVRRRLQAAGRLRADCAGRAEEGHRVRLGSDGADDHGGASRYFAEGRSSRCWRSWTMVRRCGSARTR